MSVCNCPGDAFIETIPNADCPFDLKQIQKVVFQRAGFIWDSAAIVPTNITLLADWTPLLVAIDVTKVSSTPLIGGDPVVAPGEAITEGGGDNSTLNGVEDVTGTNPSVFTCNFKSMTPAQEKSFKKLMCEKSLVVYLINQDQKIIAKKLSATTQTGITVNSLFLGDRNNQGFGVKDMNAFRFSMPAGWSEDIEMYTPGVGFNPLTDL